ncbi:MAG: hypothetical protein JXB62_21820 [Pirellulales bacterium]|nr:hypothetical protein [Pirellulales bacterium]
MQNDEPSSRQDPPRTAADQARPEPATADHAAADLPDPSGAPAPICQNDPGCSLASTLIALLVAGGVGLLLLPALDFRATRGATRSARLQWQERRSEIQQAVAREQAYRQAAAEKAKPRRGATDD